MSGNILWLIDVAGDPRTISPFLDQLRATAWKGRPLRMRMAGSDGKVIVQQIDADAPPATAPATPAA